MLVIGVDIGGGSIKLVLADDKGEVKHTGFVPIKAGIKPKQFLSKLKDGVEEIKKIAKERYKDKVCAIGIGLPGLFDLKDGIVRQFPNLPGWEGFPLKREFEAIFDIPIALDNDANVAAVGEAWLGAAKNIPSFVMITLGTGIGGAIFLNGELWRGTRGFAGEIGHMKISDHGIKCGCGGVGCLESYAGGWAIQSRIDAAIKDRRISAPDAGEVNPIWLAERARQGRNAAIAIYSQVGRALGIGMANLILTLDVDTFILVGGGANALSLLEKSMREGIQANIFGRSVDEIHIVRGTLGEMAGRLGAVKEALDLVK